VVVVLFYAPGDDYDTIQTRETRAGALAVNAGFLALNVNANRQVNALAARYEVRDAPATLIFRRGPRVVYRVAGYMDRYAVAQAAANAR
jgi:thioredoxin-related protein